MSKEKSSDRKKRRGRSRSPSYSESSSYSSSKSSSTSPERKKKNHKSHRRHDRSSGAEEREREKNRKIVENRPRQWQVASDENVDRKDSKENRKKSRYDQKESSKQGKRSSRRRRGHSRSDNDDSSSSSSYQSRDRHRKHRRKRHRKDHKKQKSSKSERKHSKKDSRKDHGEHSSSSAGNHPRKLASQDLFGTYGIIKESDFHSKKRSFEVWLSEVKQLPSFTGPQWELKNYFKEYVEDYNTATMPHIKYYDYDKWEIEEYERQKQKISTMGAVASDEAAHWEALRKKKEDKKRMELELVRGMMNKEKIEEMKRQAQMKQEMAVAFKTGDEETKRKLQKRLEPEEKKIGGAAHPWSK